MPPPPSPPSPVPSPLREIRPKNRGCLLTAYKERESLDDFTIPYGVLMKPCVNNLGQNGQTAVVVEEGSLTAPLPKVSSWITGRNRLRTGLLHRFFCYLYKDFFFSFNRHNWFRMQMKKWQPIKRIKIVYNTAHYPWRQMDLHVQVQPY